MNEDNNKKQLRCRGCGSAQLIDKGVCRPLGESSLKLFSPGPVPENAQGRLYRCLACGLELRIPCLDPHQLDAVYAAMEGGQMSYPFETNGAWAETRKRLMQLWGSGGSPRILDVGCYEGGFLLGLPEGWIKVGIEPCNSAKEKLKKAGIPVISDSISKPSVQSTGEFDAVCLFDVLEHLPDPCSALVDISGYLKPGGKMFISTLDTESWGWRWLGTEHWYLESPQHLTFAGKGFFQWFCSRYSSLRLTRAIRISHQLGNLADQWRDFVAATYFGFRKRKGIHRIAQRLIHYLPRSRYLMHKEAMPCTFYLPDHLWIEIEKTSCLA